VCSKVVEGFELGTVMAPERLVRSRRGRQVAAGAGVHHWCPTDVDGGDDLFGGDSLQLGCRSSRGVSGRAGAGSSAAGSLRAAAR